MQISELGEFRLIDRIASALPPLHAHTLRGIGDDCAVLRPEAGEVFLSTTDLLMEGIHFDLVYSPLRHLGYKAAVVNLSDLYAMNATPRQLLAGVALSKRFAVEDVDELYAGIRLACQQHEVDLAGGDTSASLTGLTLSLTALGTAQPDDICGRDGAQDTDLICVSGNLGAAYLGLCLLEREKGIYLSQLRAAKSEAARRALNFAPDFSGREYLLERFLKPEARRDIILALRAAGIRPTAMIDVSDGLSSELLHICQRSGVGCRIYEDRLPIDYQTAVAAEELNLNVSTCALNGGEDYELLFTVPLSAHEQVEALDDVKIIGHITRSELGAQLVTRDGNEFALRAQGWDGVSDERAPESAADRGEACPFALPSPLPRRKDAVFRRKAPRFHRKTSGFCSSAPHFFCTLRGAPFAPPAFAPQRPPTASPSHRTKTREMHVGVLYSKIIREMFGRSRPNA